MLLSPLFFLRCCPPYGDRCDRGDASMETPTTCDKAKQTTRSCFFSVSASPTDKDGRDYLTTTTPTAAPTPIPRDPRCDY